jgi:hypothetical protein
LLFVLPTDPDPVAFRNWRDTLRAWHFGSPMEVARA